MFDFYDNVLFKFKNWTSETAEKVQLYAQASMIRQSFYGQQKKGYQNCIDVIENMDKHDHHDVVKPCVKVVVDFWTSVYPSMSKKSNPYISLPELRYFKHEHTKFVCKTKRFDKESWYTIVYDTPHLLNF